MVYYIHKPILLQLMLITVAVGLSSLPVRISGETKDVKVTKQSGGHKNMPITVASADHEQKVTGRSVSADLATPYPLNSTPAALIMEMAPRTSHDARHLEKAPSHDDTGKGRLLKSAFRAGRHALNRLASFIPRLGGTVETQSQTVASVSKINKTHMGDVYIPTFTEAGLQEVAALHDDNKMSIFVHMMLASENKFIPHDKEGKLASFVQWYSGTKATHSLAKMREDLSGKSWVKDLQATFEAPEGTEAQYQEIAALQNDLAMTMFIKKLLADENKYVKLEEQGQFAGFVQWFSGTKAIQNLAQMRKELFNKSWVKDIKAAKTAEAESQQAAALHDDQRSNSRKQTQNSGHTPRKSLKDVVKQVQAESSKTHVPKSTQVSANGVHDGRKSKNKTEPIEADPTVPGNVTELRKVYRQAAASTDISAMSVFIKDMLAKEGKYIPEENQIGLEKFVQWLHDRKTHRSLDQMRHELFSHDWVRNLQAAATGPKPANATHANASLRPAVRKAEINDAAPRTNQANLELHDNASAEAAAAVYRQVSASGDTAAMTALVKKVLAHEHKVVIPDDESRLTTFAQWLHDKKCNRSFDWMRQELLNKSWVKNAEATAAVQEPTHSLSASTTRESDLRDAPATDDNPGKNPVNVESPPGVGTDSADEVYRQVAASRDKSAMMVLIKTMVAHEDKYILPEDDNALEKFVQWLDDRTTIRSFAQMRNDLFSKSWVKDARASAASPETAVAKPTPTSTIPRAQAPHTSQEFTEEQYQKVASLSDDVAMTDFVQRMLANENRFVPHEEEGQLAGFVQWYSGTKATQNIAQMQQELRGKSWVKDLHAILATPDVTETQYQEIAALRNDFAMGALVKKLLARENRFIPLESDGELAGFVQWFSGTKATQNLDKMRQELFSKAWVKDATVPKPLGLSQEIQGHVSKFAEGEYQKVVDLHDDDAMGAFVHRMLANENKFIAKEDGDQLAGLVQWYSGTKATQSLARMREELGSKAWVKDMQATFAVQDVSETQYQAIVALHNDLAMSSFVTNLLAKQNKLIPQEALGELAGFVQWFSGTKATQSFAQLRQELATKSWVKEMQVAATL